MCHLDNKNHADPSGDYSSIGRYEIGSTTYSHQSRYGSGRNNYQNMESA